MITVIIPFLFSISFILTTGNESAVDGRWSPWSSWESCSVTCGGGSRTRTRSCSNPKPRNGGNKCAGNSSQSDVCNERSCPIDGGWSDWSQWSFCTKTVRGIQTRTRDCVNPKPQYDGKPCSGNQWVVRECRNTSSCLEEFPLRFRTKEIPSTGTMEISKNNTWKKLCTASWDDVESNLTCMAMGYHNGPIDTWCKGTNVSNTATHLNCTSLTQNCTKNRLDQFCKVPVRLNGTDVEYGGRVEVFYKGKWGRICRNKWDLKDAEVVCKQLGFQSAIAEFIGSDVKVEGISFLMSNVSCTGSESDLASCKRTDGEYDCQDDKGAQALCEPKNREVLEKKAITTQIGSSETITCSLAKNDTKNIRWYDSVERLLGPNTTNKLGSKIEVSGEKLTLKDIGLSDGGTYQCRGLSYIRVYTIYVTAEFTKKPATQTLVSGKRGIISCSAQGAPDPQLEKWSREDGNPLGTRIFIRPPHWSLYIDPVQPDDGGKYKCCIKQSKAETSTSKCQDTNISVIVLPEIHLTGSYHIQEGDNVTLHCTIIRGTPKPTVQWYKEGKRVPQESNVLFLREVKDEDRGDYTCKAENSGGSDEDAIYVTVHIPPKVDPDLKNKSVPWNTTFTLTCTVGGFPKPEINWTKDGALLPNASNMITINHTSFNDSGQYECSARNWVGNISKTVWIDVTVSPQVSVFPNTQFVPEGQATNISCKATGVPKPKITWKFGDGDQLPSGINVSTTEEGSILQARHTTKGMEGDYKCTATNKADSADSTVTVRVLEIPTADISPKPYLSLLKGDTLTLTCKVSESTSEIKWKKNGGSLPSKAVPVDGDKMSTLVFNVDTDDSGSYSCEAHNRAGFRSSSVEIRVIDSIFGWYYIVGPLCAVIVITCVSWYICKRRMTVTAKAAIYDEEQGYELEELDHEVDKWEISRDRIVLREVIGSGAFGVVWKGSLKEADEGHKRQVIAAKCFTPTSGAEGRKALMREIELGKQLEENSQPNIITFIGCVTTRIHPVLIMEYLPCGDLLGYLRKSRGIEDKYHRGENEAVELSTYDFVSFARQIATGMAYLASRGIIHRDLAARNVLLDQNCVCKITDFGLAYQNFKYGHGNAKKGCIPVKWTAPEILYGNPASLTSQSDVWSYGIVLYEIFTIGGIPYPGWTEGQTIAEIKRGYRMPKPPHIDDTLYSVMTRCWHETPEFRPHFDNLRRRMIKYIEEEWYTGLVDMSKYNGAKYSKVEDEGAEAGNNDEPVKDEPVKKTSSKKKWHSVRY